MAESKINVDQPYQKIELNGYNMESNAYNRVYLFGNVADLFIRGSIDKEYTQGTDYAISAYPDALPKPTGDKNMYVVSNFGNRWRIDFDDTNKQIKIASLDATIPAQSYIYLHVCYTVYPT